MKQDWRHRQAELLAQVKELLTRFRGELLLEAAMGGGVRADLILKTDKATYIVEIKGASSGEYLSFATWGQMTMNKKVVESWLKPLVPVIPIVITNAILTADLKTTFEKSRIPVVQVQIGEDSIETQQKLEKELAALGLPIPESTASSGSK